jgi:hypothetical protein
MAAGRGRPGRRRMWTARRILWCAAAALHTLLRSGRGHRHPVKRRECTILTPERPADEGPAEGDRCQWSAVSILKFSMSI